MTYDEARANCHAEALVLLEAAAPYMLAESLDGAAARSVADAWNNPGPVPEYHRAMQLKLHKEWPALAEAVEALATNPYRSQA
jgi:hypothetical protein